MKKTPLLHAALSQAIATLGHGDLVVIADAGLPHPPGVPFIDLALTRGVVSFEAVLHTILSEMQAEGAWLARETDVRSPHIAALVEAALPGVTPARLRHDELKGLTARARCFVRTGEFTPYANVILVAGVVF
jgi:D-ribose pyranase